MAAADLQPSEQAILADTFPPERLGMAFAIYGMAVVLAPSIGPTLGGWITDNYSWRWIFYINVPIGIISLLLTNHFVQDPDYLKEQIEERRRSHRRLRVDYIGIGLIALGIGCLQVVLDKGQEDDWFASHFIATLSAISIISIVALVVWELRHKSPVIELRLLKNFNFAAASLMMFVLGVALYAATALLPLFIQDAGGIQRRASGPGAVAGRSAVDSDDADRRTTVVARAGTLARGDWILDYRARAMAHDPARPPGQFRHLHARLRLPTFGGCLHVHPDQHPGLSRRATRKEQSNFKHDKHVPQSWSQCRHLDGGDSDPATGADTPGHFQHACEYLQPALRDQLSGLTNNLFHAGMSTADASHQALGRMYLTVQTQASTEAYLDTLKILAIICLCMLPIFPLLKRNDPRANKTTAVH